MITRNTGKVHLEFDLNEARRIFSEGGHDKNLRGELITSPFDLYSVEELRDRAGLRIGEQIPADIFVFGKGEPERRDCTKVGGLPYWPSNKAWPTDPNGKPYRFLAQINFADSIDLVHEIPAPVLLLLVEDGDEWQWEPDTLHFEWVESASDPIWTFDPSLIVIEAGPFFGVRSRSADFPGAIDAAKKSDIHDHDNLALLNGTKIGGLPTFIQNGIDNPGTFLFQLGSIQAAPQVPYPWVNEAAPRTLASDAGGIFGIGNSAVFCDMGSLYVFRNPSGHCTGFFETF